MKRCPECGRSYNDDSMSFCLDDGSELLFGPASMDEPVTAILHSTAAPGEAPTLSQIHTTGQTAVLPANTGDIVPKPRGLDKRLLAAPFLLAIVVLGGFFGYKYFTSVNSKQIESIAVMPFVNESGNIDVEYLSDGMTETLISSLTQVPNLSVKARSSVFRYKGKEIDSRTVGKDLNVQAILIGRVGRRGDQLSLSLELVEVASENAIWSRQYTRKSEDLIALQSEIARDVSSQLKAKLSGTDVARVEKSFTANPEAYQLYLRGRFHAEKRVTPEIRKSIEYFQQAIAIDPNYVHAYAGLADSYSLLSDYGGAPAREAIPEAKLAAFKALSIDSESVEAHTLLCSVLATYDYDFAGAERECQRAIQLDPDYAPGHHRYGLLLTRLGKHAESQASLRRALALEPLSLVINRNYGESLFYARSYPESIAQFQKTIDIDPTFSSAYYDLAYALQLTQRQDECVEAYARSQELTGEHENARLIREKFKTEGWRGFLKIMTTLGVSGSNYTRAIFLGELGEFDKAFAELEAAFDQRLYRLAHIKVDPRLDPLRTDPRFERLLKRMNLPE